MRFLDFVFSVFTAFAMLLVILVLLSMQCSDKIIVDVERVPPQCHCQKEVPND